MKKRTPLRLDMPEYDPRDFVGYGRNPTHPQWPGGARIAVQIALNYEAGGEHNILYGDAHSEGVLADAPLPAVPGKRLPYVESAFEYSARVGAWRLLRIMRERGVKCSILAVVQAIEFNREIAIAAVEDGHEMVGHGYRWIDYVDVPEAEREYISRSVASIERITGKRPVGWMSGRPSMNTRRLLSGGGRISLRPGFARRRAALLGRRLGHGASLRALLLRDQRSTLRLSGGFRDER
jgi:peptidoglycan/xylan/chitin deacetylase (PgdA/CDA1 family)